MEAEGPPVYCICRKPYDDAFMIECDECKDWFHGSCVGVQEHLAAQIERYHCPLCEKKHGPLTLKERPLYDPAAFGVEGRQVKTGVLKIIRDIKQKHFPSAEEIVVRLRGRDLTTQYFETHGFNRPIMVDKKEGLDLHVPPPTFSVEDVEKKVGPLFEFDVIDVEYQEDQKMVMRQWTEYFNSPGKRDKILNVISLEFSKTDLAPLVEPPRIVKELSWVSALWPSERIDEMVPDRPEVQKYCLMGVKDSFTDFHIDFGGTSVWYHVLKGEKVFFFVEPTETNLQLFESWESSAKQNQVFFGDMVDRCWRLVVKQGQTVFIPTAWIHAVYTPIDSLVFGGNFLHIYNVPLQLEAYEIERRLQTNEKYQFPNYETVNWFAAKYIYDNLQGFLEIRQPPPAYMLSGGEALARHLKKWTQRKDYAKRGNDPAQLEGIRYGKLIKELNSILKKFSTGAAKAQRAPRRKGKKAEEPKPVLTEEKQPMLLRLDFHKHKEEKKEEMDEEKRKNVYNFQDDDEDEAPPLNILKVRIPKTEAQTSQPEEQKVPPVKLGALAKGGDSGKRKRKHKKSRCTKKSKKEIVETEEEEKMAVVGKSEVADTKLRIVASVGKEKSVPKAEVGGVEKREEEEEDSDKDTLVVDERPNAQQANRHKPSPVKPVTLKLKQESKAVREPAPVTFLPQTAPVREESGNSIADILKVAATDYHSRMATADSSQLIAVESMLSMSSGSTSMYGPSPFGLTSALRPTTSAADEEEQLMADCYQDSEFMYPSFEMSDEEQLEGKSTKVQEKDDNWNPKARVNVPNKGEERLQRVGAKNQAVVSGLAATAKKLEENPQLVKKVARKMSGGGGKARESRTPSHSSPGPLGSPSGPTPGPSSSPDPGPSTSGGVGSSALGQKRVFDRTPAASKPKCKKYRKGYKTAKQRIGKLIKIC
ncbi:lysine-specific demethylase phf2-like isoform X2 [Babylonia areolata]|uniref:lysine-specific demethylase phf2-like isoform X2 n=1 Tax=Babylonia areolata TaxID=304850 RepID=UPI003FD4577F